MNKLLDSLDNTLFMTAHPYRAARAFYRKLIVGTGEGTPPPQIAIEAFTELTWRRADKEIRIAALQDILRRQARDSKSKKAK